MDSDTPRFARHLDRFIQPDQPMDSDRDDDDFAIVYCGQCGDEHEISHGEYHAHFDELGHGVWYCQPCIDKED